MKRILVVQNVTRERLGLLEQVLRERGAVWDIADLDAGDPFPDALPYDALIVFGGPDSANDATTKMIAELERIRAAALAGMPYLGVCLGMQALVKALGGRVIPSPVREIGWRNPDGELNAVALTEQGLRDPLFAGLESPFVIFQLHGETVELSPEMALLAQGRFCRNQVIRARDRAYGIQGHFELTPRMFSEWLEEDADLKILDRCQLQRDYESVKEEYERVGLALFRNFLDIAGI